MSQVEMSPWHWTWVVWERDKCGSMGKALVDIGPSMQLEIAALVHMKGHTDRPSANLVVANLLNNGKYNGIHPFWTSLIK